MIRTATHILAPLERCFRLSLSVDLDKAANDRDAIAGTTRGLIGPGESVTWQERHFGWRFRHESLIDIWRPYSYFREVMVEGMFGAYHHEHHFAVMNDGTRIRDEIRFTSSTGLFGRIAPNLVMRRRIMDMLKRRNLLIKRVAESEEWHRYLDGQPAVDQHIYQALSATAPQTIHAFAK